MFAAIAGIIAAIIAAVGSVTSSAVAGGRAGLLQQQQNLQSQKAFAQNKTLTVYGIYSSKAKMTEIITVAGFIGILLIIFFSTRKDK